MKRLGWLALCLGCACATQAPPETETIEQGLTAEERRARLALIRDAAAEMGVHNAALLAGIAVSETQLAHCWSEATYACMGPASSSCGEAPVIAGSADGPCSAMQGGLGMFQFDAGTYADTLATYGDAILTIEGNTAQAVSFVIDRLPLEVEGTDDWMSAAAFMNGVPMQAGDSTLEAWAQFLACRYNGCCSDSALCASRAAGYRDNALAMYAEQGAAFWDTRDRCVELPADGVIEQRSACYVAGGDPRYWRRVAVGHGGTSEWTATTASETAANFARWLLRSPGPDRLELAVYLPEGVATARTATYRIVHAGITDAVVIDQSAGAGGFVPLGTFDVDGNGDEYVELADHTGTSGEQLAYDALRVTSLNRAGSGSDDGGCAATGNLSPLLALALLALRGGKRRSRAHGARAGARARGAT